MTGQEETKALKTLLKEQCVLHTGLDVTVLDLQEKAKDLSSRANWVSSFQVACSKTLESYSIYLNHIETVLKKNKEDWKKYDKDQSRNVAMAHL